MRKGEVETVWERVTGQGALETAWHVVADNAGVAGGDGVSIHQFRTHLFANITQLRAELLQGTYRSSPFKKVSIPKRKPGYRILTIPSIRDRVLHTSIARALTPILEPQFEESSFAYRPNRGVTQAVERIEQWHRRGYDIVIEADIISYFDNIDQRILLEKLTASLSNQAGSAPLLALIEQILEEQARALGTPDQGVVQGSPLSPLLANLYLDALDEEMEEMGVKLVRYADDFVILCKSEKKAKKVLEHVVKIMTDHNLKLHDDGTRIVNFDKGFDFIGYLFLRTLALKEKRPENDKTAKPIKSNVTDEGIIELGENGSRFDPGKRVLYVLDPNHSLMTRNRSFSVRREDGSELISIPNHRIGRIEVGPLSDFSRHPIDLALECNIDFAIIDRFGQTKGQASRLSARRATLQLSQAKAVLDEKTRATIARRLVDARIRNQRVQLARLNRTRKDQTATDALASMLKALRKLASQNSVEELRGVEGSAAALYWPALGKMLSENTPANFRRKRPADDPLNAAINYMTAILERDTRAAIQSVGLHPGFGFLHGSKDRHDGLIYDLMEPFRAPLTEGIAIFLFNARRLKPDMFIQGVNHPVEMNDEARKAIILGYEAAAAKRVNRTDGKGKLSWRAMMQHQAYSLAKALRDENLDAFLPYLMEA